MMNFKIFRPCLYQMRLIVENHNHRYYRYRHRFNMFILFIFLFRLIIDLVSYHFDCLFDVWYYDPSSFFIYNLNEKLYTNYMILLAIVTILGLQVQYSFHFKPVDTDSFIIIYELTVKTWQHYLKCKCSDNEKLMKFQSFLRKNPPPQKLPSIPLLRSICRHYHWLLCRIKFELFFHYVDKKKLESQQFASIKTILSWQCRSALVLGQNIFEFIFCYIMVSSCKY